MSVARPFKYREVYADCTCWHAGATVGSCDAHPEGNTGQEAFGTQVLNGSPGDRRIVARKASTIEARPVRWAWADRIPLGAVTLMPGREGISKGVLVSHLAARWTQGQLEGDLAGAAEDVAMLSIEDDPERVLKPRLQAAGADLDRCHVLGLEHDGVEGNVTLPDDVPLIRQWLAETDARVLVVDVPNAFLASGFDAHKDHDVRRGIAGPLTLLAADLDVSVLLVVHLNRSPSTVMLDRIAGSLGLSRASRSVLAVVENPDDETERLVVLAKSNLGRLEVPSIRYRVEGVEVETPLGPASAGRVVLLGEAPGVTAGNALRTVDSEERTALGDAIEFLTDLLSIAPVASTDAKAQGKKLGFSARTIERAWRQLGIKPRREGFGPGAVWWLDPPILATEERSRHVKNMARTGDLGENVDKKVPSRRPRTGDVTVERNNNGWPQSGHSEPRLCSALVRPRPNLFVCEALAVWRVMKCHRKGLIGQGFYCDEHLLTFGVHEPKERAVAEAAVAEWRRTQAGGAVAQ